MTKRPFSNTFDFSDAVIAALFKFACLALIFNQGIALEAALSPGDFAGLSRVAASTVVFALITFSLASFALVKARNSASSSLLATVVKLLSIMCVGGVALVMFQQNSPHQTNSINIGLIVSWSLVVFCFTTSSWLLCHMLLSWRSTEATVNFCLLTVLAACVVGIIVFPSVELNATAVLGISLLATGTFVGIVFMIAGYLHFKPFHKINNLAGRSLTLPIDILFAAWFVVDTEFVTYFFCRVLAMPISISLSVLWCKTAMPLKFAKSERHQAEFLPTAARINLATMLIGGAFAVAILSFGPILFRSFQQVYDFHMTLVLIVFAASCPALFGAADHIIWPTGTGLMMRLIQTPIFVIISAAVLFQDGSVRAEHLAIALSAAALTANFFMSCLAFWLYGVLPGATAILFGKIKLN